MVAVATAQLDGRPVVISGSRDRTVRVWDLTTGRHVGSPFTGHTREVVAVAAAQLDRRPVVISGSHDNTVRVWDLATGRPVGSPFIGHADWVWAVATTQIGGRPIVISGSMDKTVRVWDLVARAHALFMTQGLINLVITHVRPRSAFWSLGVPVSAVLGGLLLQ